MTNLVTTLDVLPGEDEVQTVTKTRARRKCVDCGKAAHFRHTFLLPNSRSNPASAGYRKDDISWCSDEECYTCRYCPRPEIAGYSWCTTFSAIAAYAHMFLVWKETACGQDMADLTRLRAVAEAAKMPESDMSRLIELSKGMGYYALTEYLIRVRMALAALDPGRGEGK